MFKRLPNIDWSDFSGLLVGAVLAIAICVSAYILVAKLHQEGVLGKKEYNLYSNLVSGQGLRKGTTVQINGVDVGSVGDVLLNENGSVKLKLTIDTEYKPWITNKSVVYATRDQNIISERVINIDISEKGDKILEDEEYLIAGAAQDIETVLKTANELIDRVGELVNVAEVVLNMVKDTNTTIGMLIGPNKILYNRLDHATITLNKMLTGANSMIGEANSLFGTINYNMPKAIAFADTLSTGVMGLMGNLDNLTGRANTLINSLDTTMRNVGGMVNDLNSVVGTAGNLILDGSQAINKTDDFIGGVSKIWPIRNKLPQKDTIPLLEAVW
jgi:phospholipid/cholesterol/gamma-HCH transport system substrate-binding protein